MEEQACYFNAKLEQLVEDFDNKQMEQSKLREDFLALKFTKHTETWVGEIEKRFVKPLRGELDSIAKAQQAAEATTLETRLYVSTVHADVSQAQGDAKHQLSWAIQLAVGIAKAHNSFEHATAKIRLEKSELQQVQDFAKKMKQYGATVEIRRLIDSGLEELKHRIDGMEKVGDELSSTIKTQAASMEELHNLLQRDATENANCFTALEGALKMEHQSNFDAMIEKKFNDFDNKLQVALDGQSNSFHNLLTSKFREEIQTLVRTTANEHSDRQASKFNSLVIQMQQSSWSLPMIVHVTCKRM